jgi:hypothetical protein
VPPQHELGRTAIERVAGEEVDGDVAGHQAEQRAALVEVARRPEGLVSSIVIGMLVQGLRRGVSAAWPMLAAEVSAWQGNGSRARPIANCSQLYKDIASGPFFGFNRPGAKSRKA